MKQFSKTVETYKFSSTKASVWTTEFRCKLSLFYYYLINPYEKSRINQFNTEWCGCGKCGVMDTNIKCLWCHKIKALVYFKLFDMRYSETNAVTQRV